ncbi:MAG TPA: carboxypeptidase-like regulatory domain-containing protein, partial [Pyrinomonadaceae bacterium]|nr:carboxypeptidase-like regulatory domain-containing protein [Pyrinomonadaceae bacterium]
MTLILSFAVGPATAQDLDDISVAGMVTDERGSLVPGASITLMAETTNVTRRVTSDDAGRYRVVELASGAYRLLATADGFAPTEITNLSAASGQVLKVDVTLRPGG